MQSILKTALCLAALCLPGLLVADVVTLKNGDRVTGKVISSDAEKLKVATEFMGEIEIQWDAVSDVVSEDKLYLSSKDGQVLVGPVTTAGEEFQVETTQSGEVAVPKAEIVAVRNEEAQEAYVAEMSACAIRACWTSGAAFTIWDSASRAATPRRPRLRIRLVRRGRPSETRSRRT